MSLLSGIERKKAFNENGDQGNILMDKRVDKTPSTANQKRMKKLVLSEMKNVLQREKQSSSTKSLVQGKSQVMLKKSQKQSLVFGDEAQECTTKSTVSGSDEECHLENIDLTDIDCFDIESACYPQPEQCGIEMWSDMTLNPDSIISEIVDESPTKWSAKEFVLNELQRPSRKLEFSQTSNQYNDMEDLEDFPLSDVNNFFPLLSSNRTMSDSFIFELPDLTEFDYY